MVDRLPARAQVVIVGGGVVGCSVAYHLARRGWSDVVLLERNQLTSGTTWHAAGLITQARPTWGTREVVKRSLEIFKNLESDTGGSTGYIQTGTLHLAMTSDRWDELRRQASTSRANGITAELHGVDRTVELFPLLNPAGIVGSLYYPGDGRATATDTTMSLARGARQRGVTILESTRVTGVITRGGRAVGVSTGTGVIEAEYVVNCTGMWAREFGRLAGAQHPVQALAHYYVVTEKIPGVPDRMPTLKSADDFAYVKDEAGALMVGFFEPGSYPWASRGIPEDAAFTQLPEDWEHIGPFFEPMLDRIPVLAEAGIRLFFGGPESFTPDGLYHLGEVAGLRNYFVAAGFNSVGLLSGPGAGSIVADWIVDGRPPIDLPETDPRRVMPHETNRRFLEQRVTETLDLAYEVHWPFQQRRSARPLRRSPLYECTARAGAVFGELHGWERPNWYAMDAAECDEAYSWERPSWLTCSAEEHEAVRTGVGIFDISSYGKFLVQGRDALAVMQRVCANDVDVEGDRIVYTQWLNKFGGIEADVTVTRLAQDRFLVLSGPATAYRDLDWLSRHVRSDEFAAVTDVSGTMAMVSIMGPDSRRFLQELTDANLSNVAFPFLRSRQIDLGLGFVRATRISYVGELGWELLIPHDTAVHVWETLMRAGASVGLRPAGYYALNSLRIEKGYRSWGHDISAGDTPLEAGLAFAVCWDKPGGFIGRGALIEQRQRGFRRRLLQFALTDPEPMLHHDEPVFREGELVGRISSAMYGHTIGASVGLGYVTAPTPDATASWFETGQYEIEVAGERLAARVSLQPMYDPRSDRPRG